MRTIATILTIIILSTLTYGQEESEMEFFDLNIQDSLKLDTNWTELISAIRENNSEKIKELSLAQIVCDICVNSNYTNENPDNLIPVDTFINMVFTELIGSQLWKAINERSYSTVKRVIPEYWTSNLPEYFKPDLTVYELWIQTYKPNEWVEGHEGQSHGFQFVLIDRKFKLYGITSIP